MPSKRQPSASEPPKRRASTTRRAATSARSKASPKIEVNEASSSAFVERLFKSQGAVATRPPIVGADEKRELILAHAAMRKPRDPVQMLSLWAGVVTTFLVVISAWWWASKPGYLRLLSASPREGFESVQQNYDQMHQKMQSDLQVSEPTLTELKQTATRLDQMSARATANQTTLQRLAADVSSSSSAPSLFTLPTSSTSQIH